MVLIMATDMVIVTLELYKHNLAAYRRAVNLLNDTGKAAVIHPTGTGKTFIAFKLCEDNADKRILWLSPGDYIFKTQLESAKQNGFEPKNIIFYTYAKLTYATDEEIDSLLPDYIVLDEFHRTGAPEWGKRVKYLLERYAEVPVLGLSATNIRYLDGQRDMADEIFEGNIASQMTLGEAIVRGILLPPTYVTAIYSYAKDLKKYERKVDSAKSAATRDAAQKYLDSLRRAIDMADGLDDIFCKYITNKNGKFIVFCPDRQEMGKLLNLANSMFGKVNQDIRTYIVYSEDPLTDKSFAAFKEDNAEGLKLLYSIDMLNEGVHVPDVDGVILFRPTVSPIIYKQQIGRALSASKDKQPVIFDIVNNFENLYAIGTIEQEMEQAIGYYRLMGQNDLIVNERFTLIDEAKDCRQLFDNLEQTLTVPWNTMYSYARKYYVANGNLNVPKRYKTPQGYNLGIWLSVQRRVREGKQYGILTDERIAMLDSIGMVWESARDLSFEYGFSEAQKYFEQHGNLNVISTYKTESGFALGSWLTYMNTHRYSLSEERIARLNSIGMIWNKNADRWYFNYDKVKEYYEQHGDINVPYGYVTEDGFNLFAWLASQRRKKDKLTDEQVKLLNSLGYSWRNRHEVAWDKYYEMLLEYKRVNGNVDVPVAYSADGYSLGKWLSHQRTDLRDKLTEEQRKKLEEVGVNLQREDPWEMRYSLAKDYFDRYGNLKIPVTYKPMGICLNKWLNEQKQIYRGKRAGKSLSQENIARLEAIGIRWN